MNEVLPAINWDLVKASPKKRAKTKVVPLFCPNHKSSQDSVCGSSYCSSFLGRAPCYNLSVLAKELAKYKSRRRKV